MATASYESALQLAQSLSKQEQLHLIQELSSQTKVSVADAEPTSILDICGLGSEIWKPMDAQEYVKSERSTWAG